MKINKKKMFLFSTVAIAILLILLIFAGLFYFGVLHFNNPDREKYPVRGVDVSAYQGKIDWPTLAKQGVDFVYIKATEGSSFTDSRFAYNLEHALKTTLAVGAYHFFSFDSPGKSQAEHFMDTVPINEDMLPPVIDVEFYGGHEKNPLDKQPAIGELTVLLDLLEQHYHKRPMIYATKESYDLYIAQGFGEYGIWIRDVLKKPALCDGRGWTFWQFSNRHRLDGYAGEETYIDMNVFNGTKDDFYRLIHP